MKRILLSLISIGRGSFEECTGLTKVEIVNSVITIEYEAFRDCTGLKASVGV